MTRQPVLVSPPGVVAQRSSEVPAIDDADVVAAVRYIHGHRHMAIEALPGG